MTDHFTPPTEDVERLARFTQSRDARVFGFNGQDGLVHPTWDETGMAQDEYRAEAAATLKAIHIIGYRKELTT